MADKQMFLKDFEARIGSVLTVVQTAEVMRMVSEQLDGYTLEAVSTEEGIYDSEDLLRVYLEAKEIEGRSAKTIAMYRGVITRAMQEIRAPIRKITVYHLRSYLMKLRNKGDRDSTVKSVREVLCAYFGWLHKEGLIEQNPCSNLSPVKCAKVVRLPYSDVEIEKIKEACSTQRDKAIISFLLSTGCRISEMCALNREDIDLVNAECIVHGKGNKERTVYISPVAMMNLKTYLSTRKDLCPALFTGKGTERIAPGGVRFMLKGIEERSGVENVHPHRFRRTLATNLINRGMPIQEVAAILGHDKLDTTMKYVYIDSKNLKTAYQKYA
jgi:site-specific recombinase XerD